MILNRKQALAELESRGFPPDLYGIGDRQPSTYFTIARSLRERFPKVEGYLPLWEENGESIVAYDMFNDQYVRRYYEDSNESDEELLGKNYQQFLTKYFLELADAGLDDDLEALAERLGYKHLPSLLSVLNSYEEDAEVHFVNSLS